MVAGHCGHFWAFYSIILSFILPSKISNSIHNIFSQISISILRSLHSICNILIALESFLAIFQDASYFVSFFVVSSGLKFIRYQNCFPILLPLAVCGDAAQITMLFTGIDRLFSVLFPVWCEFSQIELIPFKKSGIKVEIVNIIWDLLE
jgi:hypothetical protein